jgi:hypothetical protein
METENTAHLTLTYSASSEHNLHTRRMLIFIGPKTGPQTS